ncbi:hypothetical protein [Aeropyrum camini]|uniref:hypothetical protein n=1 Tax=Aeropyrum camini TaxID=229980 RepID=UPI00078801CD|nr:hypothetical protein [Aeropyrum camini]
MRAIEASIISPNLPSMRRAIARVAAPPTLSLADRSPAAVACSLLSSLLLTATAAAASLKGYSGRLHARASSTGLVEIPKARARIEYAELVRARTATAPTLSTSLPAAGLARKPSSAGRVVRTRP